MPPWRVSSCPWDWRVTLVCAALFLGAVTLSRICLPWFYSGGDLILYPDTGLRGAWNIYRLADHLMEFYAVAFVLMAMAIWRHKTNIKRLLSGTENKLWGGKEKLNKRLSTKISVGTGQ